MRWLERHDWPGNVRELGNVVQRLAVLSRDTVVTERDVETVLRENGEGGGAAEPSVLIARAVDEWVREKWAGAATDEIGRASRREGACQYVESSVGAGSIQKTYRKTHD